MNVEFGNKLSVMELAEGVWQLNTRFYCYVYEPDRRIEVIIPQGYITDFCSVPRIPFAYLLYGGVGNRAGVLHDGLYSAWDRVMVRDMDLNLPYVVDRAWADEVLAAGLKACGVGAFKRGMMYSGVRMFGWQFYKKKDLLNCGKESE
jgi:hypothetical protein